MCVCGFRVERIVLFSSLYYIATIFGFRLKG